MQAASRAPRIEGVIFDMDGVMFDTEPIWSQQWRGALAAFGLVELPGFADAERGQGGDAACATLRRFYGEDIDAETIFAEYLRLARLRFREPVPKKPGLDELLAWLGARGIPCAVASSSPETVVRTNLRNAGIEAAFAQVVTGDMVAHSKPAPDIFLEAARRLGCAPEHALVLEDSYAGVRAGAAGGFVTVMVPDLLPPTPETDSLVDACLPNLLAVRDTLEQGEL